MTDSLQSWTGDDRQVVSHAIRFSIIGMVTVLLLVQIPIIFSILSRTPANRASLLLYSLPQALTLAILGGVPLGVFLSLAGRAISHRSAVAVLILAIVWSSASVGLLTSLVPTANRAAREAFGGNRAERPPTNELTFRELREQRESATHAGLWDEARTLDIYYHTRWALSFVPLAFVALAVSVAVRRPVSRLMLSGTFGAALIAYYLASRVGMEAGLDGTLPGFAAAWLPNVAFAALSAGMALFTRESRN